MQASALARGDDDEVISITNSLITQTADAQKIVVVL
jgi:hypothetical protein